MSDQANGSKIKILVVDDDRAMLMMLQTQIEDLGYDVMTAADGKEAWDTINVVRRKIDIVVIDREMPNMNGLEFVKKIKEDKELKNIPVIMQTGSDRAEQIKEGIDAGVYYYLIKPMDENPCTLR